MRFLVGQPLVRCRTGAGKTYSLSSIQPNNIGMMPRAASELFTHIGRDAGHMYIVTMSYVQIYMEMLQVRPVSLAVAHEGHGASIAEQSHDDHNSGNHKCAKAAARSDPSRPPLTCWMS